MKLKLVLILMLFLMSTQYSLSSNIYPLYDCPSLMDYTPNYYANPEKSCQHAELFGLSKSECYKNMKEEYTIVNNEYKMGKCKDRGHKVIEGQYNSTQCSIQFTTTPNPQIYGHGYANKNEIGYNRGEDTEGAKCIDIIYKELKGMMERG